MSGHRTSSLLSLQDALSWKSSPNTTTILPMSSPSQSKEIYIELEAQRPSRYRLPLPHRSIVFVFLLFPVSTAIVFWTLTTLPISISWPRNISNLAQFGQDLHGYVNSGPGPLVHVILVMSLSAIWKHAWSIPGSVLWNVIGGALFPSFYAIILLATLTMLGSVCATLLAKPLGPFLGKFSSTALSMTRSALSGSDPDIPESQLPLKSSSAWIRLSILRLVGVVPWSGINIACGICDVPLADCMLGSFIGCLPWTVVTCQIGAILQTVTSTSLPSKSVQSLITQPEILLKLVLLTTLSLALIFGRSRLQAIISSPPTTVCEWSAKRTWIKKWKTKLVGTTNNEGKQEQLQLVQEKRQPDDA